jgi:hypothetical protein
MKHFKYFLIIVFFIISCNEGEQPKVMSDPSQVKVIIVIDKTISILNNSIPRVSKYELNDLLDYISMYGGEIALSNISESSKDDLVKIRNHAFIKPHRKKGQTAVQYSQELYEYEAKTKNKNFSNRLNSFLNDEKVDKIYDYSNLRKSSDVVGAIEMAHLYLTEPDLSWNDDICKYAIFVTDGEENIGKYELPEKFEGNIILVNRTQKPGIFANLKYQQVTSFDSAIRLIIEKSENNGKN